MASCFPFSKKDNSPPEKDVVSLVVEGNRTATLEVRILVEQGGKHASHPLAQACVEVVQDQLRLVTTGTAMTLQGMRSDILRSAAWAAGWKQVARPLALLLRLVTSSQTWAAQQSKALHAVQVGRLTGLCLLLAAGLQLRLLAAASPMPLQAVEAGRTQCYSRVSL